MIIGSEYSEWIRNEYSEYPEYYDYAWDCDPHADMLIVSYDADLDEEEDETDWQVIVLDRFGDRMVNPNL